MPSSSDEKSLVAAAATALAFVAVPLLYYQVYKKRCGREEERRGSISDLRGSRLKPPFPPVVRDVLSKCRLAYLSTLDADSASSHLSLMRFTYLQDEQDGEVVIMSTNRRTKKFEMLQKQKGVALLVHDFAEQQGGGSYSVTLNGACRIVEDPEKAEHYRAAHLAHNQGYQQFIVGEDIAILCVDVTSARICDINDHVTKWDVTESTHS
jgi:general stress protein 26